MNAAELCFLRAVDLRRLIDERQVSVRDVVSAHLDQIERVNPRVNAVVTLTADAALAAADDADRRLGAGEEIGVLGGLPVLHKDLVDTKGIRTTHGSPLYADHVPAADALIIERLRAAGAGTMGKTNTPEFGAGSQTFNRVFGRTLNPYNTARTCGGSSGGAAVALACGLSPIADGSDTGGSLRNPANFCNVVGFRPSPGRVPQYPAEVGWFPISVQGPMARTVEDAALMLAALAGPDPRSPIAISESGDQFLAPLERDFRGVKIAYTRDFGELPVDPRITSVIDDQRGVFETVGCRVEDACPSFADADEIFQLWRAWRFELRFEKLVAEHRDEIKETILWNVQKGREITGPQLARAERDRTLLYHRLRTFMEEYEFLVAPVSQVPPFDVEQEYITEIDGVAMETYIDWMKSCYFVTVTGLPAISVPCGFTSEGTPVGVQIIGRHQDDLGVLQLAYAFQQATEFWRRRPGVVDETE